MVTMIGLINANLMTVEQTIGVIIGQEVSTTLTAQIVAFDIGNFNMVFVVLGVIFFEFFENRDWKKYGEISFGIGIVFLGMTLMSGALKDLIEIPWVADSLVMMGQYPLAGVLAGCILTVGSAVVEGAGPDDGEGVAGDGDGGLGIVGRGVTVGGGRW